MCSYPLTNKLGYVRKDSIKAEDVWTTFDMTARMQGEAILPHDRNDQIKPGIPTSTAGSSWDVLIVKTAYDGRQQKRRRYIACEKSMVVSTMLCWDALQ